MVWQKIRDFSEGRANRFFEQGNRKKVYVAAWLLKPQLNCNSQFNYFAYLRASKKTVYLKKLMLMSHFTAEKKANIFKTFGGAETNTGSIEAQVAMLTERINHISGHLKTNRKDFSSNRGLMLLVGRRKRMLQYLSNTNLESYRSLIEKLGLRK
jgi:small subunit ribosomal protein S15